MLTHLLEHTKNEKIKNILNNFDICTPDGFPVAMASKILYKNKQKRVDGYKIFNNTLKKSEELTLLITFWKYRRSS